MSISDWSSEVCSSDLYFSMARSTIWIARSTPAQNPRGAAINIRKGGRLMSLSVMDAAFRRLCPRTNAASFRFRASHGPDKKHCRLHQGYHVSIQKALLHRDRKRVDRGKRV